MPKLITCSDCGKQISRNARTCPSCGAPQKSAKDSPWRMLVRVFALVGLILFGLGAWSAAGTTLGVQCGVAATVCGVVFVVLLIKR